MHLIYSGCCGTIRFACERMMVEVTHLFPKGESPALHIMPPWAMFSLDRYKDKEVNVEDALDAN